MANGDTGETGVLGYSHDRLELIQIQLQQIDMNRIKIIFHYSISIFIFVREQICQIAINVYRLNFRCVCHSRISILFQLCKYLARF